MATQEPEDSALKQSSADFVVFTIVANNYLAYARTLMASVAAAHPDSTRFIVLCDELADQVDYSDLPAHLLLARDLGIPGFAQMAFVYDVMELSTAVKPYTFLHLFDRFDAPGFLYIDPDILLLRPLKHVRQVLDRGATMVLTPHMMEPLQDGKEPSDLTIMKSGVYNLGFLAAQSAPECRKFIKWWADRCTRDAIVDIPEHKFTDQRWMDLAPAFVRGSHILRHPGYNLAYWNLAHRPVHFERGAYKVGSQSIHFVHFSGVVPSDATIFSKHQDRFKPENIGGLRPLFENYVGQLNANAWGETHKVPYAYNSFADGRTIHRCMRSSFRRHDDGNWPDELSPFEAGGGRYDEPEPTLRQDGPPFVSRVLFEVWNRRADLRQAFPIQHDASARTRFLEWVLSSGHREEKLDPLSTAIAEAGVDRPSNPPETEANVPAWRSQSEHFFSGRRTQLGDWLSAPIPLQLVASGPGVPLPRLLALVWEARADLQQHFRNRSLADVERFLIWSITSGCDEGSVDASLLADSLGPYLDAIEAPGTDEYIPQTRLMRLLRSRYAGKFPELVKSDPRSPLADQLVALWLCGIAAERYGWPQSFFATLHSWLSSPSVKFARQDLGLNRAMALIYTVRSDLQDAFDISTSEGCLHFASWLVNNGVFEHELAKSFLPPFLEYLRQPLAHTTDLSNFHQVLIRRRRDICDDLESEGGCDDFLNWISHAGSRDRACKFWNPLLFPERINVELQKAATPRICLTGAWTAASGRAEDVRMTAECLRHCSIEFVIFDRPTGQFLDGLGRPVEVNPQSIEINIAHLNADTALADFLAFRRAGLSGAYTIGYWAWELSKLPPKNRVAFSFYDEIWAATHFAQGAFEMTGAREVNFMPMAVETPKSLELTRTDFSLPPQETFTFYYGFDFRSFMTRKNPAACISAFREAFPDGNEKVALVLKTLGAEQRPAEFRRLQELCADDPRIELRDREYSPVELATLIKLCDCYVSPHRSEGFGRGPAEAMRLGVPVIATGYSGNEDFTKPDNSFLIKYSLVPVNPGEYPGWEDQVWADPSVADLALLMKEVVANPERARARADAATHFMQQHYSSASVAINFAKRLSQLSAINGADPVRGGLVAKGAGTAHAH